MITEKRKKIEVNLLALAIIVLSLTTLLPLVFATPTGPDLITSISNETKPTTSGAIFNISGGYISTFNLTASVQNPHYKAFVGNVTGVFTLDDSTGATIYDWTLSAVSGEIYASRNSSVSWTGVNCANSTHIASENTALQHTGDDNITATFSGTNVKTFVVAGTTIAAGNCSSINTYVNNATQGTEFEEVVLRGGISIVYATVLEPNEVGFDGNPYDFQMIVPEIGNETWTGATAYYVYVELS